MKEHTYQLTVELQVRSANMAAQRVEELWHTLLAKWLERAGLAALVSAIKCAEVHKFDEAHFSRPDAKLLDLWVNQAIDVIAQLVEDEANGGFGEFDAPAEILVKSRWPNVVDWECSGVTYSEGVVTLHDLYVVE